MSFAISVDAKRRANCWPHIILIISCFELSFLGLCERQNV